MLNILHCTGLYFCVIYLGYDASLLNGLQVSTGGRLMLYGANSNHSIRYNMSARLGKTAETRD